LVQAGQLFEITGTVANTLKELCHKSNFGAIKEFNRRAKGFEADGVEYILTKTSFRPILRAISHRANFTTGEADMPVQPQLHETGH